jgi:negative regulator of flagellin synthesis FlgM
MIKISSIAQSIQSQQVQRKGRKTEVPSGNQANDKVAISSEARKLQDSSAVHLTATKAVNDVPEVREDKIEEVRQKISDGFYDQANIASVLADKLLREFGI